MGRRDDREYREYLREEQRSQPGCPKGWSSISVDGPLVVQHFIERREVVFGSRKGVVTRSKCCRWGLIYRVSTCRNGETRSLDASYDAGQSRGRHRSGGSGPLRCPTRARDRVMFNRRRGPQTPSTCWRTGEIACMRPRQRIMRRPIGFDSSITWSEVPATIFASIVGTALFAGLEKGSPQRFVEVGQHRRRGARRVADVPPVRRARLAARHSRRLVFGYSARHRTTVAPPRGVTLAWPKECLDEVRKEMNRVGQNSPELSGLGVDGVRRGGFESRSHKSAFDCGQCVMGERCRDRSGRATALNAHARRAHARAALGRPSRRLRAAADSEGGTDCGGCFLTAPERA